MDFNTFAMNNTLFNYKHNGNVLQSSSEKLSSGLKINRAGDDAAGMAISTKMSSNIRNLYQANKNVENGKSIAEVAESALVTIQDMATRISELCIQSLNDTYNVSDKEKMQLEVDALIDEIKNIVDNSEYNGINLFRTVDIARNEGGDIVAGFTSVEVVGGMPSWVSVPPSLDNPSQLTPTGETVAGDYAYTTIDFSNFDGSQAMIDELLDDSGFFSTCCTCNAKYSITFSDTNEENYSGYNPIININISGITTAEDLVAAMVNQAAPYLDHFTYFMVDPNDSSSLIIYDNRENQTPRPSSGMGIVEVGVAVTTTSDPTVADSSYDSYKDLVIHYGNSSGENVILERPDGFTISSELYNIDVTSREASENSLEIVEKILDSSVMERTKLGVFCNRLDYNYELNQAMNINLERANSKIQDADMAKEIMKYTAYTLKKTATESMLSSLFKSGSLRIEQLLR